MTFNEAAPSTEVQESGSAQREGQHCRCRAVFGPLTIAIRYSSLRLQSSAPGDWHCRKDIHTIPF